MRSVFLGLVVLLLSLACEMVPVELSKPGVALLYGVGDYISVQDLKGPPNDVSNLKSALSEKGWTTTSRINSFATIQNLQIDLNSIASNVTEYQKVILFFSGHGTPPPFGGLVDEEAIVLHDGGGTLASAIDANDLLTPSELASLIAPILAKKAIVIVVFDACFSGGFVVNGEYQNTLPLNYSTVSQYLANRGGAAMGQALGRYFNGTQSNGEQGYGTYAENLWVVSAAGPGEESWEANDQGIFSKYFTEGLSKGDANGDGFISIYEAYRYSYNQIQTYWNIYTSYSQDYQFLPQIVGHNYDLSLVKR